MWNTNLHVNFWWFYWNQYSFLLHLSMHMYAVVSYTSEFVINRWRWHQNQLFYGLRSQTLEGAPIVIHSWSVYWTSNHKKNKENSCSKTNQGYAEWHGNNNVKAELHISLEKIQKILWNHQDHTSQDHFCSVINEFPVWNSKSFKPRWWDKVSHPEREADSKIQFLGSLMIAHCSI